MCGACSMYGGEATCIHVFSAVRDVLEDPRYRWEDTIMVELQELEWQTWKD